MNGTKELSKAQLIIVPILLIVIGVVLIGAGVKNKNSIKSAVGIEDVLNGSSTDGAYVRDVIDTTSTEYLELKRLLYFIPYRTDHYYLIFNSDYTKCISYKGSSKWNNAFNSDTGLCDKLVTIEGKVEKLPEKADTAYDEAIAKLRAAGYQIQPVYYSIDSDIKTYSTMQILAGISLILMTGVAIIVFNSTRVNEKVKFVGMASMVLCLISMAYIFLLR